MKIFNCSRWKINKCTTDKHIYTYESITHYICTYQTFNNQNFCLVLGKLGGVVLNLVLIVLVYTL